MAKRYSDEFKKQIVELVKNGKRPTDIDAKLVLKAFSSINHPFDKI